MKEVSNCCSLRPLREKVAEGRMRGFTLIELLVAVIIIAILAAIAVPQYKKAVLKSRFSTVMPMAKSIADAQEVYYQGRQLYALDVDELDVTPVNAENTSVALSQTDGYDYVMAQNSQVPGANYIIYQKYSENYPSEIHCEAADDNEDAQWLCGVLSNNNSIGKTITDGYTTYVINGTGAGIAAGAGNDNTNESGQTVVSCASAEAMGYTCNITTNEAGKQEKQICTTVGTTNICRTKTYNEDGSYTSVTCKSDGSNGEGVCTSYWGSATYDANGNKTSTRSCSTVAEDGTCSVYGTSNNNEYTYDANGNIVIERQCNTVAADGSCSVYSTSGNWFYTYDANGKMLSQRDCIGNVEEGSCSGYFVRDTFYTYDENGNLLTKRMCNTVKSDGTGCTSYDFSSGSNINYTYDDNGNRISQRTCKQIASDGSCSEYKVGSFSYNYDYTYDANGNKLTQRNCNTVAADGTCSEYSNNNAYDYTYDANGNMTSERECQTVASDGSCSVYASYRTDYTYDDNGNQTSSRQCGWIESDGTCREYNGTTSVYIYDDNGKKVSYSSCFGTYINTTTGECIAYNNSINVVSDL